MAELIDVACDICGQKYRWGDDRVGRTASCRECGTKFAVEEFIAPPDDADEEAGDSPLPWIKGACVVALIVAALGGLGSLLVVRPSLEAPAIAANSPGSPPAGLQPAARSPRLEPGRQPQQNAPDSKTPQMPNARNRFPSTGFPAGFGQRLPIPRSANPEVLKQQLGAAATPRKSSGQGFGLSDDLSPEPEPAQQIQQPSAAPVVIEAPEGVPVVTGWTLVGEPGSKQLRLTGRGLQKVTGVQELVGLTLIDEPFKVVGDAELRITKAYLKDVGQAVFAVSAPDGMAVGFCDAVRTVASRESLDKSPNSVRVFRVRKGGRLEGSRSAVVLVEAGGLAHINSTTPVCFLKDDAELEAVTANNLIAEAKAKVTQRHPNPVGEVHPGVITFCPLPALTKDK